MKKIVLSFVLFLAVGFGMRSIMSQQDTVQYAESDVAGRWKQNEIGTYVLIKGDFYKDHGGGNYSFLDNYYDPDFYQKNYTKEGDAIYLCSPDEPETRIRTRNEFKDDFESYQSVRDLIITSKNISGKEVLVDGVKNYDPDQLPTRWTTVTLQSPKFPTVKDYVALGKRILEDDQEFVENRVEPSTERAHSGARSARFYSASKSRSMVCSKSSMSTSTMHFIKGDDFWFSGWFYFEKGMPLTIMDLESTWLNKHSGIRIQLSENGAPSIELKAFDKPIWRNRGFAIPRNQWVHVKVHFLLDERDGELELWIDDELVVEGTGQTLPLADTVFNCLEVGISANLDETILFVDDLQVSRQNPELVR